MHVDGKGLLIINTFCPSAESQSKLVLSLETELLRRLGSARRKVGGLRCFLTRASGVCTEFGIQHVVQNAWTHTEMRASKYLRAPKTQPANKFMQNHTGTVSNYLCKV